MRGLSQAQKEPWLQCLKIIGLVCEDQGYLIGEGYRFNAKKLGKDLGISHTTADDRIKKIRSLLDKT